MSNQRIVKRSQLWPRCLAGGLGAGGVMGAVLFVAEPVLVHHETISFFGTPLVTIAAVYVVGGALVGLVAGAIAAVLASALALRPVATAVCVTGFALTTVFLLRDVTRAQLRTFAPGVLIDLAASLLVWGLLAWAMNRRRRGGVGGPAVFWLAGATMIAGGILAAWTPVLGDRLPARNGAKAGAPDIVLVVVDAMRRDHLSAYGYPRPTTPFIKGLASKGVLFENAYSQGNRTSWAMPALFTSMYPSFEGAESFHEKFVPLPQKRTTIAEMLQSAGYATVGMMSNVSLKDAFGLTQGFDRTDQFNGLPFDLSLYRLAKLVGLYTPPAYVLTGKPTATEVTDAALRWAKRAPGRTPLFLFVHYMDVHHPYTPPEKYRRMFASSQKSLEFDPQKLFAKTVALLKSPPPLKLSDDELQCLKDLYDANIRYMDTEVGRLVKSIRSLRPDHKTIVILTSDHGDEFLEHGTLYHNNVVNQELIHVPLIMWRSDDAWSGRRISALARHIDVLPTIADFAHAKVPSEASGTSLVPVITGKAQHAGTQSYAEGDYCAALIENGWKIMYVDSSDTYTLYNLSSDPAGMADVAGEHPKRLAAMRKQLDAYLRRAAEARSKQDWKTATPQAIRQLRALGYVD